MSDEERLRVKVEALAKRLQGLYVQSRVVRCVTVAAVVCVPLMLLHKARPVYPIFGNFFELVYVWAAALIGLGVLTGLLWGLILRITPAHAAALTDKRLRLRERLSSGMCFMGKPDRAGLVPELMADAGEAADAIEPGRVYPYRVPRDVRYFCAAGAAFAALALLPQMHLFMSTGDVAVRESMKQQGAAIKKVAKQIEREAERQDLESSKEMAEKAAKLARELERARLSKKQALLKTRKLTEEIRRQQQELARKNTPPSLDRALGDLQNIVLESKHGKELAGKLADKKFAEVAAKLADMAAKLKQGDLPPEEQEKLQRDLAAMAAALGVKPLAGVAKSLLQAGKSLSSSDLKAAAEKLADSAEAAQELANYQADEEALRQMEEAMKQAQQMIAQADQQCPECAGGG